eukprot:15108763-Ditylum_brightwellii.AAC.1
MYNSDCANKAESRVSTNDPITTTPAAKGYLSDGCHALYSITINSDGGDDMFDMLCNKCTLDLNGEGSSDLLLLPLHTM